MDAATQLELIGRLAVGLVLGAAIGLERELQRQPAGFRTHSLVALGAAIFTVVSGFAFLGPDADPTRIAAQVVTGIGFIGAGTIIRDRGSVRGLTTAASLCAVAAVGTAAGAGLYVVAIGSALLIIVVLWLFDRFEDALIHRLGGDRGGAPEPSEGRVEDLP
ncbi:MAG: MgtC/SapB family protein [Candidatus Limnocylindria bacterium]